jgi:hypothetical protein
MLDALPPAGTFTPRSLDTDLLLFAGGSGMTPVMSIVKSALGPGPGSARPHLRQPGRARARVLRGDGSVIPGRYAAGNTSAAVMGNSYAGAGATIGPAMTFGYLAALDLAGRL